MGDAAPPPTSPSPADPATPPPGGPAPGTPIGTPIEEARADTAPKKSPWGRLKAWVEQRNARTQARWSAALHAEHVLRWRLLVKVVAIHVRYTSGYLAAGCLVSAPLQLVFLVVRDRSQPGQLVTRLHELLTAVVLGLLLLVLMAVMIPFTRIDWEKMRLPEFKNLELNLAWWSMIASAAYMLVAVPADLALQKAPPVGLLFDRRLGLLLFTFMLFSWIRARFDAWLFRDFYTLRPDDDSLILFRTGSAKRPGASPPEAPPGSAPPSAPPSNPAATPPGA